jgi:hypothetical protein
VVFTNPSVALELIVVLLRFSGPVKLLMLLESV